MVKNDTMNNSNISSVIDYRLPFFAYGIFKPGELAYKQIESFVSQNGTHKCTVSGYIMKTHDGIPLIEKCDWNDAAIEGFEIRFQDAKAAYKVIQEMEPGNLYKWSKCVDSQDNECNILVGTDKALNYGHPELITGNRWSRSEDPLFSKGLDYLKYFYFDKILSTDKIGPDLNRREFKWVNDNIKEFYEVFELQKAYLFLFTILDRICTMKFGLKSSGHHSKIQKLCEDRDFENFFEKYGDKFLPFLPRRVNSSLMDGYVNVNIQDMKTVIDAFYQIRSNCVHTGKSLDFDKILLKQGFIVLFSLVWYLARIDTDRNNPAESIINSNIKADGI